jgi:hypothetical protein
MHIIPEKKTFLPYRKMAEINIFLKLPFSYVENEKFICFCVRTRCLGCLINEVAFITIICFSFSRFFSRKIKNGK